MARYRAIGPVPVAALPTERADVLAAYRLGEGETRVGAVLVRPDGHIAWRSQDDANAESALRQALTIVSGNTCRTPELSIA